MFQLSESWGSRPNYGLVWNAGIGERLRGERGASIGKSIDSLPCSIRILQSSSYYPLVQSCTMCPNLLQSYETPRDGRGTSLVLRIHPFANLSTHGKLSGRISK